MKKILIVLLSLVILFCVTSVSAAAADEPVAAAEAHAVHAEETNDEMRVVKAVLASVTILAAVIVGMRSMLRIISENRELMAQYPESAGHVRINIVLELDFVETLVIYALIVAILIVFVL